MNFLVFLLLVFLAFVATGMLTVVYFVSKGVRFFRRFSRDVGERAARQQWGRMSGEELRRMAEKHYGTANGGGRSHDGDRMKDGVTVEDRREPGAANRKIFARDEGEYVDFTES